MAHHDLTTAFCTKETMLKLREQQRPALFAFGVAFSLVVGVVLGG